MSLSILSFFRKDNWKNFYLLLASSVLSGLIVLLVISPVLASVESPISLQETQENIHDRLNSDFFEETVIGALIKENPLMALIALWLIMLFLLMVFLANYQKIWRWFIGDETKS